MRELTPDPDRPPARRIGGVMRSRRRSFESFVAEHGNALVFFAAMVCGDHDRGEDVAQEALSRVYRRWRHLHDPLAYARRAIVNASHDDRRRGVRQEQAASALAAEPAASESALDELVVQRDRVRGALRRLPERQRAVLLLRFWSGLTEAETAATLEVSVGTVKQHAARALSRLRSELDADAAPATADPRGER